MYENDDLFLFHYKFIFMRKKSYSDNFKDSLHDIKSSIEHWPENLNKKEVTYFKILKKTYMIFVPVANVNGIDIISKEFFYCSICKQWKKISGSVKNIKRHAAIHSPEFFQILKNSKKDSISIEQEQNIIKNIVGFILFETESFISIESSLLKKITPNMPNNEKLLIVLNKLSKAVSKEISDILAFSSCNSLTFDGWTDHRKRSFLGITIRCYVQKEYKDFFLDFIRLYEEINDADVLYTVVQKSLRDYGLDLDDITSITTDNCSLMKRTVEILGIWRIPCLCHILNLIFKEFILGIKEKISPIIDIINHLNNSSSYQNFLDRKNFISTKKIKKVPHYNETRWTTICDSLIVLYDTYDILIEFFGSPFLLQNQIDYLHDLQEICKQYKIIIKTYEEDPFGSSSFFLADISIIQNLLTKLENTDFELGVSNAQKKIEELKNIHFYFWNKICPMALLLNPQIEDFSKLLTIEQINESKRIILNKMTKYPPFKSVNIESNDTYISLRNEMFKKDDDDVDVPLSSVEKLLEQRSRRIVDIKTYWEAKIGTEDQQLAFVAIEILGMLVTSVASERSFSKGRYVINDHRTNILPEHAKEQMILQCNKKIALEVLEKMKDIFND